MNFKALAPLGIFCILSVSIVNSVLAAELLDVKPIKTASSVVIEVTADIPMTYTYYKVPGQARAVVDIADADPEKVEPLIVVNKGAISSISVDKIMIENMTVSRLVFNLVSESDISVKQEADRKKLIVSFSGGKSVAAVEPLPVAPVQKIEKPDPVVATTVKPLSNEEDPLGLDEPKSDEGKASLPVVANLVKPEPDVTATSAQSINKAVVKGIVIGSSFIDIQILGNIEKMKQMTLDTPDRLVIDIPGTSTLKVKSIPVNKFGIEKVRIGNTPGVVRIVLDANREHFPNYSVDSTDSGIRVNFK